MIYRGLLPRDTFWKKLFPAVVSIIGVQKHLEVIEFVHSIFDKLRPQGLCCCIDLLFFSLLLVLPYSLKVRQAVQWLANVSGCRTVIIMSSWVSPQNQRQNEEKAMLQGEMLVWSSLDLNLLKSRLLFPPSYHIRPLPVVPTFFFRSHRSRKIRTIMTKTRKEGIRCINRKISLRSTHFLLFVFLPAAAFTCRSQTRSAGQSPAK